MELRSRLQDQDVLPQAVHGDALGPSLAPGSLTQSRARVGDNRLRRLFKRLFDAVATSIVLVLLLPLLIMLTVLLLITQGRPVLYAHKRIGRHAATFKCFKFRTMVPNADEALEKHLASDTAARAEWNASHKLKDDPRTTPLGQILRRTSLDELPQLLNIIKGDMSLVGPRPIVKSELIYYGWNISSYYKMRPGLTGLWQISGRSDVAYERRVALDAHYERSQTFVGDLKIIAETIPAVLKAKGSY